MADKIIKAVKVIGICSILVVALLMVFLVLNIFDSAQTRDAVIKIMEIAGIFAGASLLVIVITNYTKN